MIFCARATRGLRRPSLDARSGTSISPHPREVTSELGGSIIEAWSLDVPVNGSLGHCSRQKRKKGLYLAFSEDWAYFHQETVRHVEVA